MTEELIYIDKNIKLLKHSVKESSSTVLFEGRKLSNEEILKGQCTILIVRSTCKVDQNLLNGTKVKFVGTATTGTDHINLDYLKKNGISFKAATGANSNSVAEYVIYCLLKWSNVNNNQLNEKKIGIIGYGNIGRKVALYAHKLGIEVVVNDPPLFDEKFKFPDWVHHKSISEIFKDSDIITNHVPLHLSGKYSTHSLINIDLLSKIKDNSLFLHTSRGSVVDESAFLETIKNKNIDFVFDVWENEPKINLEIAKQAIIATPHIAGYSNNGKVLASRILAEEINKQYKIEIDYSVFVEDSCDSISADELSIKPPKDISKIINRSRQIEYDNDNFRKLLVMSEQERVIEFDQLRKNYPIRNESLFIQN
ncbi:MAG: hypothetical protein NT007_07310 [Candidatus Kapabacteria bacterium]|nr:hypothetical protein [Candidatus Kapabacteria bacterium]